MSAGVPPPPIESPKHPTPADGDSGHRQLSVREAKAIMRAQKELERAQEKKAKEAADALARTRRIKQTIWGAVGGAVTVVLLTAGALSFGQTKIDAGVDKGVEPVKAEVAVLKGEITEIKSDMKELKRAVQQQALNDVRSTTMLENLSANRGLPVPPRVLLDGGQ